MRTLDNLHPQLKDAVPKILAAMGALGFPMIITYTVRSTSEQQKLFAQGRTIPGPIVTNADGVIHKSNHQLQADGMGHAVDCAFLTADGDVSWDVTLPWATYGACGKALGLKWGGDFHAILDRPHLEL